MSFFKQLRRYRKPILAGVGIVFGVGLIALLAYSVYLDRIVTRQFEGRRWTLPAQVYAEPTELYVGQSFSADTLEKELTRLGYHRVDEAKDPGSYTRRGTRIDFVNRRFQFWDATQEPQHLSVTATGNTIAALRTTAGEDVPIFRLD